jgi:hypothetical protein
MSTLKTGALRGTSGSADSIQLHASNQSVTFPGDVVAAKQNGCERIILEQFFSPCDGSVIATSAGDITLGNVTAEQQVTDTDTDVTGSSITYTPPSGATQVIYEFNFQEGYLDNYPSTQLSLYLDSDEVVKRRRNHMVQNYGSGQFTYKHGFNIGGSADTSIGRVASWSSGKTIKLKIRSYNNDYQSRLHRLNSWLSDASTQVIVPCLGITAIG